MGESSHQSSVHGNRHTQYFNNFQDTLANQIIEISNLKEMFSKFTISQERDRERSRTQHEDHKYIERNHIDNKHIIGILLSKIPLSLK